MQLKGYQDRVLSDLDTFLNHLRVLQDVSGAYTQTWMDNGVVVGSADGIQSYKDTLRRVPTVCFKVPTGGGKTVIGCAALKHIFGAMEEAAAAPITRKLVIWLVPSSAILEQTLKALRNPDHDYRRRINADFNSRVEVYDGSQIINGHNFNPSTVRENLSIVVLTFDSLRITRKDGRKAYQENGNLQSFVSTYEHRETLIPDVNENAAMQVYNQLSPVVVIDESHNATSDLSLEMLKNLNPCFVLELTATPKKNSNIISIVSGYELKSANMVKLPVIVHNRQNPEEVIGTAVSLRDSLEKKAASLHEQGAPYIRPIVLVQAQPKTGENPATFQKLKESLISAGIPSDEIAIKTSEINEIKGIDLLDEACAIRFIITVNALKEGWDCPFAYVLATLANRTSRVDVEQIVGRVLRLPHTKVSSDPMLNMSYVISSSNDFTSTVNSVISGLNNAGFTDREFRAIEDETASEVHEPDTGAQQVNLGDVMNHESTSQPTEAETDQEPDIPELNPDEIRNRVNSGSNVLTPLEAAALAAQREFEQRRQAAQQSGHEPKGGDEMKKAVSTTARIQR